MFSIATTARQGSTRNRPGAPITTSAIQLSHIGALQAPITALQPKTIRAKCSRATSEKMMAVARRYAGDN
jgi:hypothetical protein